MRICTKNPNHRRLGATRCEVPGCGALVAEVPDQSILSAPADAADVGQDAEVAEQNATAVSESGQHANSETQTHAEARKAAVSSASGASSHRSARSKSALPMEEPNLRVGIDWPWGFEPLSEHLALGRDPTFSKHAANLSAFPNVSRRHAEIRRRGTSLVLRDLGSKYGTFLDEQKIPPQQDVDLHDGAILRFANHLTATVRIAR